MVVHYSRVIIIDRNILMNSLLNRHRNVSINYIKGFKWKIPFFIGFDWSLMSPIFIIIHDGHFDLFSPILTV